MPVASKKRWRSMLELNAKLSVAVPLPRVSPTLMKSASRPFHARL